MRYTTPAVLSATLSVEANVSSTGGEGRHRARASAHAACRGLGPALSGVGCIYLARRGPSPHEGSVHATCKVGQDGVHPVLIALCANELNR